MKRTLTLLVLAAAFLASSAAANAEPLVFSTILQGSNEVPPNASAGTGTGVVSIDGNMMTVIINFSGLTGNTTASHIHCCTAPGSNAGVATALPTFPGFPSGVTSGSYLQTFDLTQASTYNMGFITANGGTVAGAQAAFLAGLQNGMTYLNIHTNVFTGGEIRGQLQPVPEPATLLLLGSGIAGIAMRRRRKRKA